MTCAFLVWKSLSTDAIQFNSHNRQPAVPQSDQFWRLRQDADSRTRLSESRPDPKLWTRIQFNKRDFASACWTFDLEAFTSSGRLLPRTDLDFPRRIRTVGVAGSGDRCVESLDSISLSSSRARSFLSTIEISFLSAALVKLFREICIQVNLTCFSQGGIMGPQLPVGGQILLVFVIFSGVRHVVLSDEFYG